MLQRIWGTITEYFFSFINLSPEILGMWASVGTLLITIIAIIAAYNLFKRYLRKSQIEKMIAIISSFDLLYYSLEKHFKTWKDKKENTPDPVAEDFWKKIDFTETVTKMQELKTLSKIYSRKRINLEILSLLEFLGDIMIISFRGEDLSEKQYKNKTVITSDNFTLFADNLLRNLSGKVGIPASRIPEEEAIRRFIIEHFID
ncbi:MAG: hypothetical protein JEY91_04040 [Spirochaetaceae bacterium]|nr:hypothetical protein [Spirochaetaceae bacterium]